MINRIVHIFLATNPGPLNTVVNSFPAPDPVIQYFMLVENSFTETSDDDGNKHAEAWKAMVKRKRNPRKMTKGKLRQLLT